LGNCKAIASIDAPKPAIIDSDDDGIETELLLNVDDFLRGRNYCCANTPLAALFHQRFQQRQTKPSTHRRSINGLSLQGRFESFNRVQAYSHSSIWKGQNYFKTLSYLSNQRICWLAQTDQNSCGFETNQIRNKAVANLS
jgi:hypothetical protein